MVPGSRAKMRAPVLMNGQEKVGESASSRSLGNRVPNLNSIRELEARVARAVAVCPPLPHFERAGAPWVACQVSGSAPRNCYDLFATLDASIRPVSMVVAVIVSPDTDKQPELTSTANVDIRVHRVGLWREYTAIE